MYELELAWLLTMTMELVSMVDPMGTEYRHHDLHCVDYSYSVV